VRKALESLDPEQRRAIEIAFYDGCTHVEIAARLGMPLGTLKTRMRQGLATLRQRLRKICDEPVVSSAISKGAGAASEGLTQQQAMVEE
jgi:RNA polymerase sigma-70 factor (ECF subfamily)